MKRLFIARHGETDYNLAQRWQGTSDIPLNEHGRGQASELATRIRGIGLVPVAVGGSTLSRAYETARIIAQELGLPMIAPDARLRERSFGAFEGLTYAECAAQFPEVFSRYRKDPSAVPDGAEAYDVVTARVRAAVLEAANATPDALLIAHGGVMRALVNSVYKELLVPPIGNCVLYELYANHETIESVRLIDG